MEGFLFIVFILAVLIIANNVGEMDE